MPTLQNSPSGQVLEMCDKQFLIDCGEGIQLTMRQMALHVPRLYNIFISHLHGDHCFGLLGLISTWGMLGRKQDLHIYAHADLEKLLRPLLDYHCADLDYKVIFHHINPRRHEVIYEDNTLTVTTLPLKHHVPTCGFLFEEKSRGRHINQAQMERYKVPLCAIPTLKEGGDYITETGEVISNAELTTPPSKTFRYAYCSDTAFKPSLAAQIEGVDCLYHEATYTEAFADRAKATQHSTAKQAAIIAQTAHVGRLILGHFSARVHNHDEILNEAKSVFENTTLAEERTEICLD